MHTFLKITGVAPCFVFILKLKIFHTQAASAQQLSLDFYENLSWN